MAKNDDRLNDLEKRQDVTQANLDHAAAALREQKGSLDKLSESIIGLTDKTAEARGSLRTLSIVASIFGALVVASLGAQWRIHSRLGGLEQRVADLDKNTTEATKSIAEVKKSTGSIATNISTDISALSATTKKLDELIDEATEASQVVVLRGPELASFVTLGKDFVVDTSEGAAVLIWDAAIGGVPPGRHVEFASVTHVSAPIPLPEPPLPVSTFNAKVLADDKIRVRMEMNTQEDMARAEKFFADGGAMSLDFGIYLRELPQTPETQQRKS